MGRLDHPQHSVILHPNQMDLESMEALAAAAVARDHGFEPTVDELGFYLGGLTESQAERISSGLRRMGINPYGGVSY